MPPSKPLGTSNGPYSKPIFFRGSLSRNREIRAVVGSFGSWLEAIPDVA